MVRARLEFGGQFAGMSRFETWLDDWPLFDHLAGLHRYDYRDDLLLCLYGHVAYNQAEGHLTAYEQFTFPPGREVAPVLPAGAACGGAGGGAAARQVRANGLQRSRLKVQR